MLWILLVVAATMSFVRNLLLQPATLHLQVRDSALCKLPWSPLCISVLAADQIALAGEGRRATGVRQVRESLPGGVPGLPTRVAEAVDRAFG